MTAGPTDAQASSYRGAAYYNEIDPFAADWIRNLIAAGLIAPGDVDTRSIVDVRPDDLRGYTQCHFFAGIGGWSYALRSAGWDDARPVWTGSCPCQPFSLAGKQKGFDDDRHLWPVWRELIRECDPAVVFGEQVASATEWLGLVRSDLEAMGRAVGAMPIQAASAGADHLRDRYWFVADADQPCAGAEWSERSRQLRGTGGNPEACNGGDLADALRDRAGDAAGRGDSPQGAVVGFDGDASRAGAAVGFDGASDDLGHAFGSRAGRDSGDGAGPEGESSGEGRSDGRGGDAPIAPSAALDWVIGADGKARRVKPGLRLLAHGVPGRVGLLRGFGNAIDPRPAAAFIEAADEAMRATS